MTSLADHEALCHVRVAVVQRSRGRTAVAAAAYRSASRLTDLRTGSVWDFSRKQAVTECFVMAPADAPTWVSDRQTLWSKAELAERRKDAMTAREVQFGIPRDLPRSAWRAFAEDVVGPYVALGAAVDVALHNPAAGDGGEQPHVHALMTVRALDPSTPTGFAATRNDALTRLFESGGRAGPGKRGDALRNERARVAAILNDHLRAVGSGRRADARSYRARGDPREPEPQLSEPRMASIRRRRCHDRRSAVVKAMRDAKRTENHLTKLETNMAMMTKGFHPTPRAGRKQDYRMNLLKARYPDADLTGLHPHMVDAKHPRSVRVLLRDGSWVEADDDRGVITTWGPPGAARRLAAAIQRAAGHRIESLREGTGAGRRGGRPREGLAAPEALSIADGWRRRGCRDVQETEAGVLVVICGTRLVDTGDRVAVHGAPSDDVVRALVAKAAADWDSEIELYGHWSDEARARVWLECQRQGVTLAGYEPSPSLLAAWEAESEGAAGRASILKAVRTGAADAELLLSAASGDVAAVRRLDPDLRAFIVFFLDDEQRAALAAQERADVIPELARFRRLGATERGNRPEADILTPIEPRGPAAQSEPRPS